MTRPSLGTIIPVLLTIFVSCRPISYYSAKLEISRDLRLTPSQRLSAEPSVGSFYFFFHTGTGLTTVDHFRKKPGAETPERLLYLETDHNQVLDRTVKTVEILKGRFGSVYAEKTCFYTRPIESTYSYVSVHSYLNHPVNEVPPKLSRTPDDLPPLTSVSLVRIFRAAPEYLVVAANYEPNGEVASLHIDGAKEGDWVHSNFVPEAKDAFFQRIPRDRGSDALKKYGIPEHIDLQTYVRTHRIPLEGVSLPVEMTVLNQHYGYNSVIRQDELKDGASVSSQFLQSSITDEERILNPRCEARFNQQRSVGLPTVE